MNEAETRAELIDPKLKAMNCQTPLRSGSQFSIFYPCRMSPMC